jgi:hypothetical protein
LLLDLFVMKNSVSGAFQHIERNIEKLCKKERKKERKKESKHNEEARSKPFIKIKNKHHKELKPFCQKRLYVYENERENRYLSSTAASCFSTRDKHFKAVASSALPK